eukprot:4192082-Amphidinium_carterae.1
MSVHFEPRVVKQCDASIFRTAFVLFSSFVATSNRPDMFGFQAKPLPMAGQRWTVIRKQL